MKFPSLVSRVRMLPERSARIQERHGAFQVPTQWPDCTVLSLLGPTRQLAKPSRCHSSRALWCGTGPRGRECGVTTCASGRRFFSCVVRSELRPPSPRRFSAIGVNLSASNKICAIICAGGPSGNRGKASPFLIHIRFQDVEERDAHTFRRGRPTYPRIHR